MADALSELSGHLSIDPEAQAVVTDFLDYTEFFPSDLFRSLSLIAKLDQAYQDDTQKVHDLATVYSKLPTLAQDQRPDVSQIREDISRNLDHALRCRESTYAESSRLCDVADSLHHRLVGIKAKLEAMPKPPSREPTPPPVTPSRTRKTEAERTTRLKLFTDPDKHTRHRPPGSGRQRRKPVYIVPGDVLPPMESFSDLSSDSEPEQPPQRSPARPRPSPIKLAHEKQNLSIRLPKQKSATPRPPKIPKIRPPGVMGTNVHSQVAGISVSNAMAALTPPPENPPLGGEWAPWFDLTDWELHLIRRRMKKNANWQPSEVMIRKELDARGRGKEKYEKAKAEADAKGEQLLIERPHQSSGKAAARLLEQRAEANVPVKESSSPTVPVASEPPPPPPPPVHPEKVPEKPPKPPESKKDKDKDKDKDKAARHKELELAVQRQMEENMRKVQQENERAQLLMSGASPATATSPFTSIEPSSTVKKKRSDRKRKREQEGTVPTPTSAGLSISVATENGATEPNTPASPRKKLKLVAPKSAVEEGTPSSPKFKSTPIPLAQPGPSEPVAEVPTDDVQLENSTTQEVKEDSTTTRSTRTTRAPKPRTPTPGPAETSQAASTTPAPEPRNIRTPSAPPQSPALTKIIEGEDAEMLDAPTAEKLPPKATNKRSANKKPSISLRLPSQKPEDIPPTPTAVPSTSTAEPATENNKPRRMSERTTNKPQIQVSSRTSTPAEPEPEAPQQPPTPSHKGMTETAASRRAQRRPAPINTSASTSAAPKSAQLREPSEPLASAPATGKRSTRKTSFPPSSSAPKSPLRKTIHTRRKSTGGAPPTTTSTSTKNKRRASASQAEPQPPPSAFDDADPNEPRHCLCRDVSYGAMVACDNGGCAIEWFHLGCVGLKSVPRRRESWYCPRCRGASDKEMREGLASGGIEAKR